MTEISPSCKPRAPGSAAVGVQVRELAPHLRPLEGGEWLLWRCVGLRGAGFPASGVLALGAPRCAALADALVRELGGSAAMTAGAPAERTAAGSDAAPERCDHRGGDLREALRREFDAELQREQNVLRAIASDPLFREAVLWQNRPALRTGVNPLGRTPAGATDKKTRQRERLVASYFQRYTVKNDTIGFFGPVGWARVADDGPAIDAIPGPHLVVRREVFFEGWTIDALAEKLAALPAMRPWLAPRRLPYFSFEGSCLHTPSGARFDLPANAARLLAACDGERTARSLAIELTADPSSGFSSEQAVYDLLEYGKKMGVISWTLGLPLELHPERRLRALLQRVDDAAIRDGALGALQDLETARAAVARAAGDADALDRALGSLEETFTRLTALAPSRRDGQTHVGRPLVYEDCRRDVDMVIGPALLARLGPPLSLVLTSARWFSWEVASRCRSALEVTYGRMGGNGDSVVRMPAFQKAVLADDSLRLVVSEIQAEFRRRWAAVLGLPAGVRRLRRRAADIRSAVLAEFDAPAPGWTLVRHVSPDVLIAAPSVAAIQAGDFQLVLGEIHPGNTLASSLFLAQHESGDELVRWIQRDLPELSVLPVLPKDRYPQRLNLPLIGSAALAYEHSPEPSGCPPERILRAGDLVVRRGRGGLEICTRDLARVFDAVDFMGLYLWSLCGGMLRMTSDAAHTPRIAIDDLVICREQWRIDPATLEFAGIADPLDRFRGVRRWARDLEMPRFIFVKTPVENKPCYVDLESPVFIDLLSKLARAALEAGPGAPIVATEMLPRPDQAWLVDAQGRRYTSELRFVALDPRAVCDVRSELRVG